MASISSPTLKISVDARKKTARCVVTCKVRFTRFERSQMADGLHFRLDCKLWEDDWIGDDHLYTFGSKYFPDSTPSSSESVKFSTTLGLSVLDQEWGRDEIYGRLTLKNLYTRNTVTARTNEVKRRF